MSRIRVTKYPVIIVALVSLASLVFVGHSGSAEKSTYPKKNIKWICMWKPGGGADTASRIFLKQAEKILGKRVLVQNITGGGGSIGYLVAKKARPDGYTLVMIQGNLPAYKQMGQAKLDIDDFDVLGTFAFQSPIVVARSEAPWKTAKDFAEDARRNPGKFTVGINTIGDACMHQPYVLWADLARFDCHAIAHEGTPQQTAALVGGHVDIMVSWVKTSIPYIKEGKLKFLGYMSPRRLPDYPDVPTLQELGWDVSYQHPYGIGGPKGLPEDVKKVLSEVTKKVWDIPEFEQDLKKLGLSVLRMDAPTYTEHLYKMQKTMTKALNLIRGQPK
jgi:tripartite-type tricarboxylate transporter receptor subunit TctC